MLRILAVAQILKLREMQCELLIAAQKISDRRVVLRCLLEDSNRARQPELVGNLAALELANKIGIKRRIAKRNGPLRISRTLKACCTSTAMQASNKLASNSDVVLAACWAHTRRKFYEVAEATGSPVAAEALRRIGR